MPRKTVADVAKDVDALYNAYIELKKTFDGQKQKLDRIGTALIENNKQIEEVFKNHHDAIDKLYDQQQTMAKTLMVVIAKVDPEACHKVVEEIFADDDEQKQAWHALAESFKKAGDPGTEDDGNREVH